MFLPMAVQAAANDLAVVVTVIRKPLASTTDQSVRSRNNKSGESHNSVFLLNAGKPPPGWNVTAARDGVTANVLLSLDQDHRRAGLPRARGRRTRRHVAEPFLRSRCRPKGGGLEIAPGGHSRELLGDLRERCSAQRPCWRRSISSSSIRGTLVRRPSSCISWRRRSSRHTVFCRLWEACILRAFARSSQSEPMMRRGRGIGFEKRGWS